MKHIYWCDTCDCEVEHIKISYGFKCTACNSIIFYNEIKEKVD